MQKKLVKLLKKCNSKQKLSFFSVFCILHAQTLHFLEKINMYTSWLSLSTSWLLSVYELTKILSTSWLKCASREHSAHAHSTPAHSVRDTSRTRQMRTGRMRTQHMHTRYMCIWHMSTCPIRNQFMRTRYMRSQPICMRHMRTRQVLRAPTDTFLCKSNWFFIALLLCFALMFAIVAWFDCIRLWCLKSKGFLSLSY